ncbi:amidase [Thozetella sp. PMI_491]|nr:amidase [Thozetella sp. PMI_491]
MAPKKRQRKQPAWAEIADEARAHRDATVAEIKNKEDLDFDPSPLVSLPPEDIIRSTTSGSSGYTARQVVEAFLTSAAAAQQQVNCLTELLASRARDRADALDVSFRASGPTGPLHGIPISVKSHIGIAGRHMPSGYAALWHKVPSRDALVVRILEQAGAVVHARTTEPQSMMQLECVSNLYGTTLNPYNKNMSSGGSSGGEAALIALGGSPLGIGSDVGGSIRVPAAACGIYGLKPTANRVPTTGWSSTPPGADPIQTVLGPMSNSLTGIDMFMRAVLAAEPWIEEPVLVPLPWRDVELVPSSNRPLRIGIMWHDAVVLPHPPITRAMEELARKLKLVPNLQVVDFPAYKHDEAWAIVSSLYFTDGGKADRDMMAATGEPMMPLTEWIMGNPGVKNLSREELEYWLEEREEYRLEYAKAWNETGKWDEKTSRWTEVVDAVICPVGPGTANWHGTAKYWTYSAVWNLLDYPALAFPAGKVDKMVDTLPERSSYMSDSDEENWQLYDPNQFDSMPVGLQLVGRRFDDEKIVSILRYILAQS